MEMNNYEKEGLSLLEIFRVMVGYNKKSKIRTLCVFAGVALVVFLVLALGYNKDKEIYSSEFNYLVETFDGNTYIDGTKFIYLDLISEETLKGIKANNEQFNDVDVTGIVRNDAITIARNKKDESVYAFTVTIKKKYFSSKEQAKDFVMEIAKVPQTVTNQMLEKLDYTRALISYAQYDQTYDDKIADLENQCSVINDIFTELLEKYGDRYLDESYDNERISSLQKKAQKIIDNLNLTSLKQELENNDYVYDYENSLPLLQTKIAYQKDQKDLVDKKITAISTEIDRQLAASSGTSATVEGLNNQLGALLIQKEELENSISKLQSKIDHGATTDDTEFQAELTQAYDSLVELTEKTTNVKKAVVLQNQKIYFNSNTVVTESGGLSNLIMIAASLGLGLGLAVLVNLVMDYEKYKKYILYGVQLDTKKIENNKEEKIESNTEKKE